MLSREGKGRDLMARGLVGWRGLSVCVNGCIGYGGNEWW